MRDNDPYILRLALQFIDALRVSAPR
jgi:hypothetical protein